MRLLPSPVRNPRQSLHLAVVTVRYSQVLSEWFVKDAEGKKHLQVVGWKVMAGGMQEELNTRLITQISPKSDRAVDGLRASFLSPLWGGKA